MKRTDWNITLGLQQPVCRCNDNPADSKVSEAHLSWFRSARMAPSMLPRWLRWLSARPRPDAGGGPASAAAALSAGPSSSGFCTQIEAVTIMQGIKTPGPSGSSARTSDRPVTKMQASLKHQGHLDPQPECQNVVPSRRHALAEVIKMLSRSCANTYISSRAPSGQKCISVVQTR